MVLDYDEVLVCYTVAFVVLCLVSVGTFWRVLLLGHSILHLSMIGIGLYRLLAHLPSLGLLLLQQSLLFSQYFCMWLETFEAI